MRSRARILLKTHKNLSEWKVFDGKEDENNKKVLVLIRAELDHWGVVSPKSYLVKGGL